MAWMVTWDIFEVQGYHGDLQYEDRKETGVLSMKDCHGENQRNVMYGFSGTQRKEN
jgi:hypothetical protein